MNERIKELSEQAENYARQQNDEYGVSYKKEYDAKFAELIIRECMELGDKALQDGKWPGDVFKEHFGIKE